MVSEGSLLGHRLPVVSSHGGRGRGALWSLFYTALILLSRAAPS